MFSTRIIVSALSLVLSACHPAAGAAAPLTPIPDKVPGAVADKQDFQIPDRVQLTGWLGTRIMASETNRLVKVDTGRLLEGYRHRPGRQSWDGEHVGKWLHAATLAWVYTGDPALRAKLDETAAELCKCQLEDGYLGTYEDAKRWTSWDVWAHKYNLIGLVTYMRYTGNLAPLPTCQRMADLLCKTFGDAPGQCDLVSSAVGSHAGMASTSVLEPMTLLYRFTGEKRYLDFCNYILRAWEQPNGPRIVSRLLDHQGVDKVGNAKAYEMLSCLNGALELYRTTGNTNVLTACLNAWQDIVAHRLYLTGAASSREHFHADYDLPNNNNVGETCVTVTWLQFNAQLLRLTGEARFAEQLERVALNQLLGAQQPDGAAWGYYVQMEGKKPYSATLDGHCCLSSGPRGIALLPTFAITTDADGAVINLYEAGTAHLTLHDGTPVTLKVETLYPAEGRIRITVEPKPEKEFSLKLRVPAWSQDYSLKPSGASLGKDGYTTLRRPWKAGDVVELNVNLSPRLVLGDHLNQGKAAVCYGPLVLAAEEALLPASSPSINALALAKPDLAALGVTPEAAPAGRQTWPGAEIFRVNATTRSGDAPVKTSLIPFADAGATGARYKVWLPLAGQPDANVLLGGVESRSRPGNLNGSINDDDLTSGVVTFDGKSAAEDWFAVALPRPATISRVVFVNGGIFHDGGWFDASKGKPRVQIQRTAGGEWETLGELAEYPATTATDVKGLKWGSNQFTLQLNAPVTMIAVRVIGVPASGDTPQQAFSSCAELQALAENTQAEPATREISREQLLDSIRGGWVGMLIGGLEGLPHEFKYKEQPRATLPDFTFLEEGARSDDDNDFEWPHLFFMDQECVSKLPYPRIVEIWKANMNAGIWVANKRARELMDEGVVPPATGSVMNNKAAWYNLSGQFCVESYGLIAPGMPQTAADIGLHYARIAVSEEPLQAAQFWTSLIALLTFHQGTLEEAFQQATAAVDPRSCMAEVVADSRKAFHAYPDDWKAARQELDSKWRVQRKWNDNSTPVNGAAVCLALLYGSDDFYRTLRYAMALGYDADCNAATAGTVVGVRVGFKRLAALPQFKMPDHYVNKTRPQLPAECKVSEQAETLLRIAERVILANGGEKITVTGQTAYRVKLQHPRLIERQPEKAVRAGDNP